MEHFDNAGDHSQSADNNGFAHISGSVTTQGGDFISRDKIIQHISQFIQQIPTPAQIQAEARQVDLLQLAEGVYAHLSLLQQAAGEIQADDPNAPPFKGLYEYRLSDAQSFYGRGQTLEDFMPLLERAGLTVLHSESGAGKTSLILAGVYPRLITQNCLPVHIRAYNRNPAEVIKARFVPNLDPEGYLGKSSLRNFFHDLRKIIPGMPLYIFLDQFEEFFTWVNETERAQFVNELADCLEDETLHVRWVIALRAENFSSLATFQPRLRNPFDNQYRLNQFTPVEATQIILQPLAKRGIQLADGLLERILADLGKDNEIAPPQLQLVCRHLFDRLDPQERAITLALYEQEGRADGILRNHLDRVLHRELPVANRAAAQRLLESLVSSDQKRVLRTRGDLLSELSRQGVTEQATEEVLLQLANRRLLRVVELDDGLAYELVHDYLLSEIHLDPETVSRKAAQELLEREVWAFRHHGTLLTRQHLAFINLYLGQMQHPEGTDELIQKSQEEIERKERAEKRRARIILAVAVIAALIMSVLGWVGMSNANRADRLLGESNIKATSLAAEVVMRQTAEASALADRNQVFEQNQVILSRQLASESRNALDTSYDLALLLSLQAYHASDTPEARSAMLLALEHNPQLVTILEHGADQNNSIAFSPDGRLAAIGYCEQGELMDCEKYRVNVWDLATHAQVTETTLFESYAYVDGFTPDGNNLVLLMNDTSGDYFVFWDFMQHKVVRQFDHNAGGVAFAPDGKWMASAGFDNKVILWDLATGQSIGKPMIGHITYPISVDIHPSGSLIATGGSDGDVLLWDAQTQELAGAPMYDKTGPAQTVKFNATGSLLAVGTSTIRGKIETSYLLVWDTASQKQVYKQELPASMARLDFDASGQVIIYANGNQIKFLDTRTWKELPALQYGLPSLMIYHIKASPDGRSFLSSSGEGSAVLWDLGAALRTGRILERKPGNWVFASVFTPDGQTLFTGGMDGMISIYEMPGGELSNSLESPHVGGVRALAISPDAKTLVSGGADGSIAFWDLEKGTLLGEPIAAHQHVLTGLSFNKDGSRLVSVALGDEHILVWDAQSRQIISKIPSSDFSSNTVMRATMSPTQNLFAACGLGTNILIWDLDADAKRLLPFTNTAGTCAAIAFSPDGSVIAATDAISGQIVLIEPDSGRITRTFAQPPDSMVPTISFSADGKTLIAGLCADYSNQCTQGSLALWDIETAKSFGVLDLKDFGLVSTIAYHPSLPLAVIGVKTGEVFALDLDESSWQARICQVANRNLSLQEWNQYLGEGFSYQKTCPDLPPGEGAPADAPAAGESSRVAGFFTQAGLPVERLPVSQEVSMTAGAENTPPTPRGQWQSGQPTLIDGLEAVFHSSIQCRENAASDSYTQDYLAVWAVRNTRPQWIHSSDAEAILTDASGQETGRYPVGFALAAGEVGWLMPDENVAGNILRSQNSPLAQMDLVVTGGSWQDPGAQAAEYSYTLELVLHRLYGSPAYPQHNLVFKVKNTGKYRMDRINMFGVVQNPDGAAQDFINTKTRISLEPGEEAYIMLWSKSLSGRCVDAIQEGEQSAHIWLDFLTEDEQIVTKYTVETLDNMP